MPATVKAHQDLANAGAGKAQICPQEIHVCGDWAWVHNQSSIWMADGSQANMKLVIRWVEVEVSEVLFMDNWWCWIYDAVGFSIVSRGSAY